MKSKKETSTPKSGFQPPRPRTAILADIASLGAAMEKQEPAHRHRSLRFMQVQSTDCKKLSKKGKAKKTNPLV